ncbi:MAG: hypothetical protein AAFV85_21795 [Cyanobacteria bacterium J06634_6]
MSSAPTYLLVDAHVHLHDCFDLAEFLDAARINFQIQSRQLGLTGKKFGVLLLTECSGVAAFTNLVTQQASLNQQLSNWNISTTSEATSLRLTHTSGDSLFIMAGRQVVTKENIEVLTLITEATIKDGLSLEETIQQAITSGSLPVLPWGVGKWIGKRGTLVSNQLAADADQLFTGDNGGRPGFWPQSKLCQEHRQLPGSDPLPLSDEVQRPGSFGFVTPVPAYWTEEEPASALKQLLQSTQYKLRTYGQSQSFWKFVKNQTLLRLT